MLNIIFIIIIIISLGIIIYVIWRKFSKLALIDLEKAPIIKQDEVKKKIIEERLKRNLSEIFSKIGDFLRPVITKIIQLSKEFFKKLIELEEEYRYRVLNLRLKDKIYRDQRVNKLLTEAENLKQQQQLELAEKKYIEILKIDQYFLEAYKGLADLYWLEKNYEQAKETLEYALKLREDDDFLYRQMARISSVRGDLKKAEQEYLRSINLNSQNSINYFELANIYLQLEDYPKTLEIAKRAVALEENNPKYLDFLLEISLLIKDKVLAADTWEKLRQVNPENKKLDELKERIDQL